MSENKDELSIPASNKHRRNVRFEIVHGNVRHTNKLIEEEIRSYILNLERGASMEISEDEDGTWSPLDYLLRTMRPDIDVRSLKPNGMDIVTLLMGAGLDIEKRMNVFKFMLEKLQKHALASIHSANKEDFNIILYMRRVFEADMNTILVAKLADEGEKK